MHISVHSLVLTIEHFCFVLLVLQAMSSNGQTSSNTLPRPSSLTTTTTTTPLTATSTNDRILEVIRMSRAAAAAGSAALAAAENSNSHNRSANNTNHFYQTSLDQVANTHTNQTHTFISIKRRSTKQSHKDKNEHDRHLFACCPACRLVDGSDPA